MGHLSDVDLNCAHHHQRAAEPGVSYGKIERTELFQVSNINSKGIESRQIVAYYLSNGGYNKNTGASG